ncbi:hypothetical protein, partial [Paraburkholderia sp. C35]|uniref:hypothetical protein n=1 Tax=Paraburkholderia sp. C35 TaxID=2126993 RepID=UPI00194F3F14
MAPFTIRYTICASACALLLLSIAGTSVAGESDMGSGMPPGMSQPGGWGSTPTSPGTGWGWPSGFPGVPGIPGDGGGYGCCLLYTADAAD